jgi:hypothetical protein
LAARRRGRGAACGFGFARGAVLRAGLAAAAPTAI